jgi:hypothetical protein
MTTTGISRPDAGPKVPTESTITGYLGSPAFTEDPFPAYLFFLDHPGWPSPSGYRVFARFDDVLGILRDPDTFGQPGRVDGNFHTVDPPELRCRLPTRESRPPMTCAPSSASRLAIKE